MTKLENRKNISFIGDDKIEIKKPMEMMMAVAGTCEINSIRYFAEIDDVKIKKIDVEVRGEYEMDLLIGKKEGPNTYTSINVDTKIYSEEEDKNKLAQVVQKGIDNCPVLSTLKLSGIKININTHYI